jgi:phosphopantothenoylcysteine decarboxylase/phosphopantothenate--cysteine ligase
MMSGFEGKEIVLGVTGSIAAYKACDLASRLIERGAKVTTVLTTSAQQFVGAASFEAITGRHVVTNFLEAEKEPEIQHIAVARRADLFVIAPATANAIAKSAHGIADDWLSTALLATDAPVLIAPAMNAHMFSHPATQANLRTLIERGVHIVGPDSGQLACGEVGPGRLVETPDLLDAIGNLLYTKKDFTGKRVLMTSGSNQEPIDPVRYIANRSSGKMGCALAREALQRGAQVLMVSGPSEVAPPRGAEVISVRTAAEMFEAVQAHFPACDIFIAAAAVADYRVEAPHREKQKRDDDSFSITLHPNPDIAATIGYSKKPNQICVGFAAETHDLTQNAKLKLEKKNLDLIVANEVGVADSGFGTETTRAWLVEPDGTAESMDLVTKTTLSGKIFDKISRLLPEHGTVIDPTPVKSPSSP